MNRFLSIQSLGFATGVLAAAGSAHAWLGGFENNDGYQPFLNMVQNYNAGHYGPNSGYGGTSMSILPNTDFWTAVQGGFSSGGQVSYATGHQFLDRTYVNTNGGSGTQNDQALQLTTGHQGWGGPALEYTYKIDSPDLGGVNPLSTGNGIVKVSFWWRTSLQGFDSGGQVPEGYFGSAIQFRDSSNTIGFQLGLTQRSTGDKVTLWNGSSLFETTLANPAGKYDRWDLTFNLQTDTFSADYYQFIPNTLTTLVTNQPLMAPMNDLFMLDFRTSPGITNEKFFGMAVDDFRLQAMVPEPATVGAVAVVGAALLMRRPRRA